MNNKQISALLGEHTCTRKVFNGVFSIDTLPKKFKPGIYIVNTDKSGNPGIHWICLLKMQSNESVEYFDSYGRGPYHPEILHFIGKNFKYCERQLQSLFSSTCGQYCCFVAHQRAVGKSFKEILNTFCRDPEINDAFVNDYIKYNFSVDVNIYDYDFIGKQIAKSLLQ